MVSSRKPSVPSSRALRGGCVVAVLLTLLAGCKEADEIRQYKVERVEPRAAQFVVPDYDVPAGWVKQPAAKTQFARFRETFRIGDGSEAVEMTVSALRGRGTLLDDINRWRNEIQLEPLQEAKDVHKLTAAGKECEYVDLVGPSRRTLAVILPRPDYIWYFKMTGPKDRVGEHKAAFEKFVRSVRFADG